MIEDEKLSKILRTLKDVLYHNLMSSYLPFLLDKKAATFWASQLDIPKNGKTIFFTSYMYQMSDVFKTYEKFTSSLGFLGKSKIASIAGTKLIKNQKEKRDRSAEILRKIYLKISNAFPQLSYLYEDEPYSGALLYELGFINEFKEYGKKLNEFFIEKGVEMIITVDPHTTNALENLKKLGVFNIKFSPYFDFISGLKGVGEYTLHDSCLYSKFLGKRDTLRDMLKSSGLNLVENEFVTGKSLSFCCGAPLGPIDPKVSEKIAEERARILKKTGKEILVVCPLCYENLSPYTEVKDIMEVLS
ncbi:heterodisulfide reductase-related iron-sulfur binding cluster [Caldiplasma sukawensis]